MSQKRTSSTRRRFDITGGFAWWGMVLLKNKEKQYSLILSLGTAFDEGLLAVEPSKDAFWFWFTSRVFDFIVQDLDQSCNVSQRFSGHEPIYNVQRGLCGVEDRWVDSARKHYDLILKPVQFVGANPNGKLIQITFHGMVLLWWVYFIITRVNYAKKNNTR